MAHAGTSSPVLAERREQSSDVLTFPRRLSSRSVEWVPTYLVETFLARTRAGEERAARDRRARSAAAELAQERTDVRFDRSIHMPEDEICLFIFDAPSAQDAALTARRAGLDPLRVVEAVLSPKEEK